MKSWFGFKITHQFIIIWLSLAAFLHNILMNGANNVVISSLQKEFYLSSRETGVYVSVYDMGSLVSAVVIPFLSARGSKPRWIAFGMIMLFIGCLVNVLPHFLRKNSVSFNDENSVELCNYSLASNQQKIYRNSSILLGNSNSAPINLVYQGNWPFQFQLKHLLYAANIINGLSSVSMTSIAFSYIEDIAPASLSSIYESIYYAVGALGVGVGFMITSKCLTIHTDFHREGSQLPEWLEPNHPNWIGAWWIPFLGFGFIGFMLAVAIFLFPKKLHSQEEFDLKSKKNSDEEKNLKNSKHINNKIVNENVKESSVDSSNEDVGDISHQEPDENENDEFLNKRKGGGLLLSTLNQTGSIISMNQVGFYSSRDLTRNHLSPSACDTNEEELESSSTQANLAPASGKRFIGFSELLHKSLSLFKNPVYVFVIIATTIEGLLQNSFLAFASLFLEYQYRLASGTASFIIGILSLPPLIVGGLLSGIIVKKLKNDTIACFKLLAIVLFVNILVYSGFLIYCKEPTMIQNGMKQFDYTNSSINCFKTASNCNCDPKIFKPVCLSGSNDIFFQSPCLAGCSNYIDHHNSSNGQKDYYSNCTQSNCDQYFNLNELKKTNEFDPTRGTDRYFIDGLCPTGSCKLRLIISYTCIFFLMLLNALLFLPYLKVTIGCVNVKEMNTIILGLKQFFMNAFGTIPGPILFGSVIDSTCTYWHTDASDQSVCKIYNNQNFALGFGLLGIGFKTICFILVILSLFFSIRDKKHVNSQKKAVT